MPNGILLAVALAAGAVAQAPPAGGGPYLIEARILSGDPLGSRAAGTLKYLGEPKVVVKARHEALCVTGNRTTKGPQFGPPVHTLRAVPVPLADGRVTLHLTLDAAITYEQADGEEHTRRDESYYVRTVAIGETIRVRWGRPSDHTADQQTWAEVTVRRLTGRE